MLGQFDPRQGRGIAKVYNLIILIVCWIFYTVMTNAGTERPGKREPRDELDLGRRIIMVSFLIFLLLPIYWLVNMSFKTNTEIVTTMIAVAAPADAGKLQAHLH